MQNNTLLEKMDNLVKVVKETKGNKYYFYWSNMLERQIVKENWGIVSELPDFREKYKKLINGLDIQSVETVVRILNRQRKFLTNNSNVLDIYTSKEQEELRKLNENLYDLIIKISSDLYAYKQYFLPCNHFEASVFYYKHGIEKVSNIGKVKDSIVIDVGGYIGDSVLVLSELCPRKIYTFEAVPENYKLLEKTLELNNIDNVVAENVALGKEKGSLAINLADSGSTPINRKGIDFKGQIRVPVISLDEYVREHNLSDIGLIKVDIEGGEPAFLEGAKQTIFRFKPILLISIYHNAHDFFELKPMIEEWGLGYTFTVYKPTDGSITSETLLIAEICK